MVSTENELIWESYEEAMRDDLLTEGKMTKIVDTVQTALDFIGFEPTVGTVADATNTFISIVRALNAVKNDDIPARNKHLVLAAVRAISMVPAGDVAKFSRLIVKDLR